MCVAGVDPCVPCTNLVVLAALPTFTPEQARWEHACVLMLDATNMALVIPGVSMFGPFPDTAAIEAELVGDRHIAYLVAVVLEGAGMDRAGAADVRRGLLRDMRRPKATRR